LLPKWTYEKWREKLEEPEIDVDRGPNCVLWGFWSRGKVVRAGSSIWVRNWFWVSQILVSCIFISLLNFYQQIRKVRRTRKNVVSHLFSS
jgi:hypothetical protein